MAVSIGKIPIYVRFDGVETRIGSVDVTVGFDKYTYLVNNHTGLRYRVDTTKIGPVDFAEVWSAGAKVWMRATWLNRDALDNPDNFREETR